VRVYKYVTSDRADILEFGRIRFTQAAALNDPFEIYPCFERFEQQLKERAQRIAASVRDNHTPIQNTVGDMAINKLVKKNYPLLSLTKNRNNLLMWAHYTDCHRGFVIGFDDTHPFFNQPMPRSMTSLYKVRYADERFVVPSLEECVDEVFYRILTTKSIHWSYEEELRMFAKPEAAVDRKRRDARGQRILLYDLPADCIKEIIFGYHMSSEHRRGVIRILEERYSGVEVYESQLSHRMFDLEISAIQGS
jgi:hypothetical protein